MTLHQFANNVWEGWEVVGLVILAVMVITTVWEEWIAEDGQRAEVFLASLLIIAGIYWVGFR